MKNFTLKELSLFIVLLLAFSGSIFSQTTIDSEDFETGGFDFTYWNTGGVDCFLDANAVLSGVNSVNSTISKC